MRYNGYMHMRRARRSRRSSAASGAPWAHRRSAQRSQLAFPDTLVEATRATAHSLAACRLGERECSSDGVRVMCCSSSVLQQCLALQRRGGTRAAAAAAHGAW